MMTNIMSDDIRTGQSWFRKLTALLILFLVVSLTAACSKDASSDQPAKQQPQATVPSPEQTPPQTPAQPKHEPVAQPQPAAELTGPAAVVTTDVNGNRLQLSDWIGKKPTIVNFWGTWCPPCRREIPELVKLYDEYHAKGVEMVSFALERTNGPTQVKAFAENAKMNWAIAMGEREMAQTFRLSGSVPETIFYDKTGKEVNRFVGARDYATFKKAFEAITAQ